MKIDENNPVELCAFLNMYANPVINKMKYSAEEIVVKHL
jgi:hypothetical protein